MTTNEVGPASKSWQDLNAACDKMFGDGASGVLAAIAGAFEQMQWAEDEIEQAEERHPAHRDRLYHGFGLLQPNTSLERMKSEMVYRSHCRELIERLIAGTDTRLGTAAEVCCLMQQTSMHGPLTSAAAGLYMRMWRVAGLPEFDWLSEASLHHEVLEKSAIDENERVTRGKLANKDRRLGKIKCEGLHHGKMVECVFLPTGQLTIDV